MKLYLATVTVEFVVFAEDGAQAQRIAIESARDAIHNSAPDFAIDIGPEIKPLSRLPDGWRADDYPYAVADGEDEMTIGEILQVQADAPTPDTQTVDLFPAVQP